MADTKKGRDEVADPAPSRHVDPVSGVVAEEDDPSQLPFIAKMINHLLTPGSSLTYVVWITFNLIMLALFCVWLMFVFSMPDNIHVWVFGILGLGLALSTNWLMKLVFSSGLDFESQQQKRQQEEGEQAVDRGEEASEVAKKED